MFKYKNALLACALLIGLSGCALTTDRIDLSYDPQTQAEPVAGADKVSVNVQILDERTVKTKVSTKKNGYGVELAPILANEDVTITIRKALEQELTARGFHVEGDANVVQIVGDLTRFYNDFKNGFFSGDAIADFTMTVLVKSPKGRQIYSRQINVQGKEANIQLNSGGNAQLALNRALENGMKDLFADQAFMAALLLN